MPLAVPCTIPVARQPAWNEERPRQPAIALGKGQGPRQGGVAGAEAEVLGVCHAAMVRSAALMPPPELVFAPPPEPVPFTPDPRASLPRSAGGVVVGGGMLGASA